MPMRLLLLACCVSASLFVGEDAPDREAQQSIRAADVHADLLALASSTLEGRDTPSLGQARAAGHIAGRLEAAGFVGAGPEGSFLWPFTQRHPAPVPEDCSLARTDGSREFEYGRDFVPVWGGSGEARGATVFLGFGIDADADRFDELRGHDLAGRVAILIEGEPRHRRVLEGPEVSREADLYVKIARLETEGIAGVLVVRRPPEEGSDGRETGDAALAPLARLGFRHSWAAWSVEAPSRVRFVEFPVLEITPQVARELVGIDVLKAAEDIDRTGRPFKGQYGGIDVTLKARCEQRDVTAYNVVGRLAGSDPALADEFVVLGAHYDHVGIDPRGRIGHGADDNASGTSALLEVAEALSRDRPRRSILACAFAAEEDGLAGSRAFCKTPSVPSGSLIAMVNLDMVGRGERDEVAAIGLIKNPGLDKLLTRANKLTKTGIKRIVRRQGQELFNRSDHYSFHVIGVPTLFFFEGLPITQNRDYHTWRDTVDKVDVEKVAATARLTFNTVWLLANDDERPPRPEY